MHKQVSIKVRAYIIVYCPPLDCRLISFRFVWFPVSIPVFITIHFCRAKILKLGMSE